MSKLISQIVHPDHAANVADWMKYRLVYSGGSSFLEAYLKQFSKVEDDLSFEARKAVTPIAAHAKAAINDIKNAIYQRMADITRTGGTTNYISACRGANRGVDLNGSTMAAYVGTIVLPELLSIGKVGVLVDSQQIPSGLTRAQASMYTPYLSMYSAESIRSWSFDSNNDLTALLLVSYVFDAEEDFGLTTSRSQLYRLYTRTETGVLYREMLVRKEAAEIEPRNVTVKEFPLSVTRIPFVFFDLGSSLLADVANHQIALLNMGSSDVDYAIKANFPFYTEKTSLESLAAKMFADQAKAYAANNAATSTTQNTLKSAESDKRVKVGNLVGRTYTDERPGFIAPPTEPLRVSMDKEEQLKAEIRQLVNLSLTNLKPLHASAESRAFENRGLEAGLSYIGLELERGEREIAAHWMMFESSKETPVIVYPSNYSLRNDDERLETAKRIVEILPAVPSTTFQRDQLKTVVSIMAGHRAQAETLRTMHEEIDTAKIIVVDPETLRDDHEAGLVSDKTASEARGYPVGEAAQAQKDKASRLAMILAAQAAAPSGGNRGNPDAEIDNTQEKTVSQDGDLNATKRTRGEA